jgi:N-acetylglutamate synthase-like GNAT family acetyltransferase
LKLKFTARNNRDLYLGEFMNLIFRKAAKSDLSRIIELLASDDLGKLREKTDALSMQKYAAAFTKISADENNFLAVVEKDKEIIATCHLTIMHSLTRLASNRLNIEAVRVAEEYTGQKIGNWMFGQIIEFAKNHDIQIIQLTTDKRRKRAQNFYAKLGFTASHEGMKLVMK